jgi:hypothetical protein
VALPQGYALGRLFASEAAAAAAEKKAQKKAEKKAKVKTDVNVSGDKILDAFNVQMQVCAHRHLALSRGTLEPDTQDSSRRLCLHRFPKNLQSPCLT